jgi:hypothetical protein
VKLNSFGETIARIETERMAAAQAAVDAGWEPSDHPSACCPQPTTQPKRSGRPIEEIERLRAGALRKARWWTDEMARIQAILDRIDGLAPRFDHGMLNLPLAGRQREANRAQRSHKALEHANCRCKHFEHLEAKYAAQIEKRTK